jgi:nucleoside-diphosphate-sugar epimerase
MTQELRKIYGDNNVIASDIREGNEKMMISGPFEIIDDAVNATIQLMQAKENSIKVRTGYNLAAISFTSKEIALEIKKHIPNFSISYQPDFRQIIADSWPASINDSQARNDWNWQHQFNLSSMTQDIIKNLKKPFKNEFVRFLFYFVYLNV